MRRPALDVSVARFWATIDRSGGPDACWPWRGCTVGGGYGQARFQGRQLRAHRLAVELTSGEPLPSTIGVLHRCDNRLCCNPSHLFLGTNADNVADMVSKGRHARGEAHAFAKLTREQVRIIRTAAQSGRPLRALAREHRVHQTVVQRIVRGVTWRDA